MARSNPKMILLLGAPTAASVLSSDDRLLTYPTSPFEPLPDPNAIRIEDYLGTGTLPTISTFNPTSTTAPSDEDPAHDHIAELQASSGRLKPLPIPAWRVLPLRPPVLHTGYTQRAYDPTPSIYAWRQRCERSLSASRSATALNNEQPIPLSPAVPRLSFDEEDSSHDSYTTDPNGSFLERSYAVHNLPTSQVPPPETSSPPPSSSPPARDDNGNETYDTYDGDSDSDSLPPPPLPPLPITKVTDLEDLPGPAAVLNPYKTHMATILVGIMKVESQIIKTKYTNESNPSGQVELLTITVGDYTFAGLQVKIWLPVSNPQQQRQPQQQMMDNVNPSTINGLEKCRYLIRGDIVLFQDLALSNFNGVVYANSLRRERSRAIFVYRDKKGFRVDLSDPVDTTVEKVRRLREWVRGYVGYEGDDDVEGIPMESF
ncbi:hypothetical protein AA313_de0201684 [Arthrobotrys entomopaga]|nr:hypothetical protein AA313_de0201684 [Arthrobotrys entomopaga]